MKINLAILIVALVLAGCDPPDPTKKGFLSRNEAQRIAVRELTSSLGYDSLSLVINAVPEHILTIDSLKNGGMRRVFIEPFIGFYRRTEGRLDSAYFWKFACGVRGALDGECEVYVEATSGKILHVDGFSKKLEKWREREGFRRP